ncbi:MAG: RDD family protein, partial [Anoxybacillus mongoliensis]|nr:RDD family protein [Anoxybacillus mongoliensis]
GDLAADTIVVMDVRREQMLLRNRSKKWMQKWQQDIPVLQLTDTERRRLERDDWLLLAAFIDRLPMLQKDKRYELSRQIAPRLAAKIQFADWEQFKSRPVAFLAGLYFLVEDDWSM